MSNPYTQDPVVTIRILREQLAEARRPGTVDVTHGCHDCTMSVRNETGYDGCFLMDDENVMTQVNYKQTHPDCPLRKGAYTLSLHKE